MTPPCPLCQQTEANLRYALQQKKVYWCRFCHFFFVDPFPDALRLHESYENSVPEFESKYFDSFQRLRTKSFAKGLEILSRRGLRGRLLDVGTGLGFFLDQARRSGWEAEGLELSDKTAAYARQTLRLPVHVGTLEGTPLPAGAYQAVTLWDVLEHLPNPESALRRLKTLLAPGGAALIRTPVCDSLIPWGLGVLYRVSLGRLRFGLEKLFKEHLFHFSERGLRHLLGRCGFRLLHVHREDYVDPGTLSRKEWARNPLLRLAAFTAILASRLLLRQDEIVVVAESLHV